MLRTLRFAMLLPFCFLSLACATLQQPTASLRQMSVANVNGTGFTMNFDVNLQNPNKVDLPLTTADYKLGIAGINVLNGQAKPTGSLPANGSLPVTIPVSVTYENLLSAEQSLMKGGGDVPYALDGGLQVGGGIIPGQSVKVPLQFQGTLPLKQILSDPKILLTSPAARKLAEKVVGDFFGR